MQIRRLLSGAIFGLTTLLGVGAFTAPFWMAAGTTGSAAGGMAHAADSPFMLTAIVAICFVVLLVEVQREAVSAKAIALLGVLVAINAVLRFAEVAIPGPGGFSPIFVLIILGGYVFGARMGFLLGALTLLASALITGGVGPWLPYQMMTAGWVGMSAPLCRPVARSAAAMVGGRVEWVETGVLALFGAVWGLLYGAIMNLWFWPYATGDAASSWAPGLNLFQTLQRYALFYGVTSLVWDLMRSAGNLLLIGLMGEAVLRILRRFRRRFAFSYTPEPLPQGSVRPLPAPAPAGGEA